MREKEAEKRAKEDLNNFSGLGKSVYVTKKNEIKAKTAERIVEARIGTGVSKGTPPKGTTIIFCKLQEKLRRLEKEWIEARSSVTASFGAVDVHSQCESFLPPQKDTERNAGRGKESTFHNSRGWDGGGGDKSGTTQDTGSFSNLGYKIRMHQVLGVKPPLALLAADTDAGMEHSNCLIHKEYSRSYMLRDKCYHPFLVAISISLGLTSLRHGLNLQRIHVLQKDLVSFAEDAFSFFTPERNPPAYPVEDKFPKSFREKIRPERTNMTLDPFPSSALNSEKQMKLISLYSRSQDLILHLSCLAPLSPLVLDPHLSSSMTGLEALEKDLTNIIPNLSGGTGLKAQMGVRLQGSLDRAKSEQLNLIRSLQSSNSMLYQWAAAADKVVPIFSTFASNASDPSLKARRELLDLSGSITSIVDALDAAEGSRILLPEGLSAPKVRSGSIVPGKGAGVGALGQAPGAVSPLDSVSRGYLGEEMSVLVNALRCCKEDLRQLPRTMEVLTRLQASNDAGSLRAFEDAKRSVLGAADITRSALSEIEKSCHSPRR